MSFILDALRKSEIERQRQSGPSMAEFPVARTDRRLPAALLAIGFLLAVNLAVVLFFMLRDSRAPEAAAPATTAAATGTPAAAGRRRQCAGNTADAGRRNSRSRLSRHSTSSRRIRPMRRIRRSFPPTSSPHPA